MKKPVPLSVILEVAEALSTPETTHRLFADAYRDIARRHTARGQHTEAERLRGQADQQDLLAMEARAEARFRAPSPYGPGLSDRQQARSLAAYRGHETRSEADDRVTCNIDPAYLPLWHRTKALFKGTPHQRYERFLEYVEAHPGEALRASDQVDDFAPPSSRAA